MELLTELRRQTAILERAQGQHGGEPKVLLSKREAARLLGVSRGRTLDAMIQNGQLHVVRLGGRLKIPAAEIERIQHQASCAESTSKGRRRCTPPAAALNKALRQRGF